MDLEQKQVGLNNGSLKESSSDETPNNDDVLLLTEITNDQEIDTEQRDSMVLEVFCLFLYYVAFVIKLLGFQIYQGVCFIKNIKFDEFVEEEEEEEEKANSVIKTIETKELSNTSQIILNIESLSLEVHQSIAKYVSVIELRNLTQTSNTLKIAYQTIRWKNCMVISDVPPIIENNKRQYDYEEDYYDQSCSTSNTVERIFPQEWKQLFEGHSELELINPTIFNNPTKYTWFHNESVTNLSLYGHNDFEQLRSESEEIDWFTRIIFQKSNYPELKRLKISKDISSGLNVLEKFYSEILPKIGAYQIKNFRWSYILNDDSSQSILSNVILKVQDTILLFSDLPKSLNTLSLELKTEKSSLMAVTFNTFQSFTLPLVTKIFTRTGTPQMVALFSKFISMPQLQQVELGFPSNESISYDAFSSFSLEYISISLESSTPKLLLELLPTLTNLNRIQLEFTFAKDFSNHGGLFPVSKLYRNKSPTSQNLKELFQKYNSTGSDIDTLISISKDPWSIKDQIAPDSVFYPLWFYECLFQKITSMKVNYVKILLGGPLYSSPNLQKLILNSLHIKQLMLCSGTKYFPILPFVPYAYETTSSGLLFDMENKTRQFYTKTIEENNDWQNGWIN
ncbi:uncharacterized protein SAPINGB_P004068 [Magnusiomyces paraingens]|uniref:F-box domain-containing protein n=1 Tax=Magnusiomyces paraingens TaxID=2606893 RepID=A0A5E8BSL4_9ASCO|nr:uncharacterized protein SAPINGB_P004068 [Saprochaete ingens]VVT54423.1 unnamed protein product [Saprochaete ingens]